MYRDSHFGVPDITATLFVVVAIFLTTQAVQRKLVKSIIFAAAAAGLAVTIKWSVWPVIVPVALGVFSFAQAAPVGKRAVRFLSLGTLAVLVFVTSFFALGFQFLLAPQAYINYGRLEIATGAQGGFALWQIDTTPGWLFYIKTLTYGIGWVMLVFALLGLIQLIIRGWRSRSISFWVLLSFPY